VLEISTPDTRPNSLRRTYRFACTPEWVLYHQDLSAMDVRVYGVLDRFAGKDDACFPKQELIAERIGVCRKTISRSIAALVQVGALIVKDQFVDGRQTSSLYILAGEEPLTGGTQESHRWDTEVPPGWDTEVPPKGEPYEGEKTIMLISDERDTGFAAFWQAYPRKTNKKNAERAWRRLKQRDREDATAALEEHKRILWTGKDQQFIPHAATWLNGRRWEDELPSVPAARHAKEWEPFDGPKLTDPIRQRPR
jgi:hypothetical protein